MRCPDCNKFVSQEPGDVDVVTEDCDGGQINVECRITQNCSECGTELKEGTITIEHEVSDEGHEDHDFMLDGDDVTDDMDDALAVTAMLMLLLADVPYADLKKEIIDLREGFRPPHDFVIEVNLDNASYTKGKGRGTQTFYGVAGSIEVECSCGWKHSIEVNVSDTGMAASSMDECC